MSQGIFKPGVGVVEILEAHFEEEKIQINQVVLFSTKYNFT